MNLFLPYVSIIFVFITTVWHKNIRNLFYAFFFFFIFNMYQKRGCAGIIDGFFTLLGLAIMAPILLIQCLEFIMPFFLLLIVLLIINIVVILVLILKSFSVQSIFITSLFILFGYLYFSNKSNCYNSRY